MSIVLLFQGSGTLILICVITVLIEQQQQQQHVKKNSNYIHALQSFCFMNMILLLIDLVYL